MAYSNLSLVIVLVFVLIMTNLCCATSQHDWKLQYLLPANAARTLVLQPPLVWKNTLATLARSYAKERVVDGKLQHSGSPIYGETIAMSPGELSLVQGVDFWVSERSDYDYGSNTSKHVCEHYTQIIGRDTKSIGRAKEKCQNGDTFVTCNYYPPGNVIGEKPH